MKKTAPLLTLAALTAGSTFAAELASWEITGIDLDNFSAPYTLGATLATNIDSADLSLSSSVNPTDGNNQYGFLISSAQSSLADAITNDHYMQFTLVAEGGFAFNLDSLEIKGQSSATGADDIAVLSSIGGFTTSAVIDSVSNVAGSTGGFDTDSSGFGDPIDLSGAGFQNISSVTFRIYGWNTSGSTGSTALRNLSGGDLVINGTVVPEPGTYALLAGMLGLTSVMLRRRR